MAAGLRGTANALASAATRSAIEGTSFGDNIIAAIPDVIGQAIGSAIRACFTGDTLVHTPGGLKRIDEIKVGDRVYARDEDFNTPMVHRGRVEELFRYEDKATLYVTVMDAHKRETSIRTTPEHPFAIDGAGWVAASDLEVGQRTIDINGNLGTITGLAPAKGLTTVHNFSVTNDHTYFVSEQGVWVHNTDYDAIAEAQSRPVEDVNVESLFITDQNGKIVGFDLWGQGPGREFNIPTVAEILAEDAAIDAYNLAAGTRGRSEGLALGMLARGGKDFVASLLGLTKTSFNLSLGGRIFNREGHDSAWSAVGGGLESANNAALYATENYGGEDGFFNLSVDFLDGSAALSNYASNQHRGDQIDIGTSILLAQSSGDYNFFTPVSAGYNGGEFIGGIGFDVGFTIATLGAGSALQARKLTCLDDFMGPLGRSSRSFLDSGGSVRYGEISTAIGDDLATLRNFANIVDTSRGHNVIVHGSRPDYDSLGGVFVVGGRATNVNQIARALLDNPNYARGSDVCLGSCWSASNGTAQELANTIGARVTAPTVRVGRTSAGEWGLVTNTRGLGRNLATIKPQWKTVGPQ